MNLMKSTTLKNSPKFANRYEDLFKLYCTSHNYNSYSDIFK